RLDSMRRRLEQPDEVAPAADERQALAPRQESVELVPAVDERKGLLPYQRRAKAARKHYELVPAERPQRLDGVALHARDALSLRCDRRRVDAEPSHGPEPCRGRRPRAGGSSSRAAAAHAPRAASRAGGSGGPIGARARRRSTRRRRG